MYIYIYAYTFLYDKEAPIWPMYLQRLLSNKQGAKKYTLIITVLFR